ncbi:ABC transporter ATP-binding protein [Enterococcus devriesei]|uniref:ABC transporter ATP-binding protein n=1 Tax=Enterococcus devriesei TaxID=319970 RepID=UPI0036D2573B
MKAIMEVKDVSLNYKKKLILENVSCQLFTGEVVGLVGPNGAGKTSLMKVLLDFTKISSGKLEKSAIQLAGLIEQPGLYPFMTGYEHLEFFSKDNCPSIRIQQLIHQFDLSKFIYKKTQDYSLGMKQRLGIALALLNAPDIIILDEPMNGLDPYSVKLLKKVILTARDEGTTFLISSHILSELEQIVDRVLLIKDGRIIGNVEHPEYFQDFEAELIAKLA